MKGGGVTGERTTSNEISWDGTLSLSGRQMTDDTNINDDSRKSILISIVL